MSRGLNNSGNYRALRDYGSTSSTVPEDDPTNFSPTEFISLSENIAQSIQSVKTSWQILEKANKIVGTGTSKDNQVTRDKIHQIQATTNTKITTTSKDLKRLTDIVRRDHKQQRLQVEKLTADFKTVVEKYSSSQRQIASKMKLYLTHIPEYDETNENADDESTKLIQDQKRMERDITFDQSMLKEREIKVKQIEADVLDVNQIMKELSVLINQQGEVIDTIDSNIENAASDVEIGNSELLKASQSHAKYRRKVFILLIIAVILGLIITGIIVSQLKS